MIRNQRPELNIVFMKRQGTPVIVTPSGLHLDPKHAYLGASSDGTVVDNSLDTLCTGCLGIKCPFQAEGTTVVHLTPQEIAKRFPGLACLAVRDDGELHLKAGHVYYDQVMGEMA